MTLFDRLPEEEPLPRDAPLAARMRPRDFSEFVGQEHLVGEGRVLRRAKEAGHNNLLALQPGHGPVKLGVTKR